jgi:aminoglycoside phosphotransferase (APT) family kinase protein
MELQTSTKVPRLDGASLRALQRVFDAVCEFLQSLPIPTTVIHGDMNEGNLVSGAGVCQLVDWSETYVGHPLVTLEHLLLLNNPEDSRLKEEWDKRLIQQYRSVMARICDPDILDHASICTPLLAAASAMYGRGAWLGSSIDSMPHRQPWIRTLARYMDRAAHSLQLLRIVA